MVPTDGAIIPLTYPALYRRVSHNRHNNIIMWPCMAIVRVHFVFLLIVYAYCANIIIGGPNRTLGRAQQFFYYHILRYIMCCPCMNFFRYCPGVYIYLYVYTRVWVLAAERVYNNIIILVSKSKSLQ